MKASTVRVLLTLPLLSAAVGTLGQTLQLDSARTVLRSSAVDTVRAIAASSIAQHFLGMGEMDSSVHYVRIGRNALPAAKNLGRSQERWLMQLAKLKGIAHHNQAQYDSALIEFQRMYRHAESLGRKAQMGAALTYQGYQLREMGDVENARRTTMKAIDILAAIPDSPEMANACSGMGSVYTDLQNVDSSVHWFQKAADLYKAEGNDHHLLNTYVNMGECLNTAGQWERADSVWSLASNYIEGMDEPMAYLHYAGGQARTLLRKGRVNEAVSMLDSAITIAREMENKHGEHYLLFVRSMAMANRSDWNQAMADMRASLDAHTTDMDYEKIRSTEAIRQQAEREKEQAIAQAELGAQRTQKWAAMIIGALALVLAAVWYRSFRAKSKAAEELRRKNEEIQRTQDQLVQSEKHREAEQVRTRIARDIHDEIGATLTKIRLLSDVASRNDAAQLEQTQRSLTRISEHARNVGQAMSDIVWAVDPARDTHQGMLDHVGDLSRRLLGDNGIDFDLDLSCAKPGDLMEPDVRRDLHLVINEAFNNILKYARAKNVKVRLRLDPTRFELNIADDGVGFEPGTVQGSGNGLRNMGDRIARHGGRMNVESYRGLGTRLEAAGSL